MTKPILCIDFDGVIHSYEKGWQNGVIYGSLTPGFLEWASEAKKHFTLAIYSSRSCDPELFMPMVNWLGDQLSALSEHGLVLSDFSWPTQKPPAWLTIDDRALQFKGNWKDFAPERLFAFKPWTQL